MIAKLGVVYDDNRIKPENNHLTSFAIALQKMLDWGLSICTGPRSYNGWKEEVVLTDAASGFMAIDWWADLQKMASDHRYTTVSDYADNNRSWRVLDVQHPTEWSISFTIEWGV